MLPHLNKITSLKHLAQGLQKKGAFAISELASGAKGALLTFLAQETKKPLLVVSEGVSEDALFQDIAFFLQHEPVEFPAWETLPKDEIAPSLDIVGKRYLAMYKLLHNSGPLICLTSLHALLQRVIPPTQLKARSGIWKKGSAVPFAQIESFLTALGYRRGPVVTDKGEFALRGSIVDIFPVSAASPYRVEIFDDTVETIRTFDPVSQTSSGKAEMLYLFPADELRLLKQASKLATLFDYFPEEPIVVWDDLLAIENSWTTIGGPQPPYFGSIDEVLSLIDTHLFMPKEALSHFGDGSVMEAFGKTFPIEAVSSPFGPVVIDNETKPTEGITAGFSIPELNISIIASSDVTHRQTIRRQQWRSAHHASASHFHEMTPGDFVVHFHSGVGRYLGVEKQSNHLGQETEYLALQYAEGSKLYVPLSQSHLVSRYIGTREEAPNLSQLGTKRWQTIRVQAQSQIVGYAHDLLQMYAARQVQGGMKYPEDSELMRHFEEDFPYVATDDQKLAVEAIKEDM
ncbi:MAG: transcription-repair-coupling factor, partial [Chlamydiota bacterium]